MKKLSLLVALATIITVSLATAAPGQPRVQGDADSVKTAIAWVSDLKLNDKDKEFRVENVIAAHRTAVREWHNNHVGAPAGTNGAAAKPATLQEQFAADSAIPKSVHENLMAGLRKDLTPEQVETILDRYTYGKVAFTMNGYHSIVPDLTADEEATILGYLKEAREEAVDYKNAKLISMVFEKYKTKSEQYLNSKGRDWHALYKAFTKKIVDQKAAAAAAKTNAPAADTAK